MKTLPLVSICIPIHNGEKYLEEALHSILRQTYRPLELVISDDNSTDQTLQIVDWVLKHADFEWRVYRHTPVRYGAELELLHQPGERRIR